MDRSYYCLVSFFLCIWFINHEFFCWKIYCSGNDTWWKGMITFFSLFEQYIRTNVIECCSGTLRKFSVSNLVYMGDTTDYSRLQKATYGKWLLAIAIIRTDCYRCWSSTKLYERVNILLWLLFSIYQSVCRMNTQATRVSNEDKLLKSEDENRNLVSVFTNLDLIKYFF
jgi:hypothetical protein